MSPFPSFPVLALLLAAAAAARAEAVLDVSGSVVSVAPRLEVRVVVTNRGDRPAVPLEVTGELLGERREARLADGVPPGGEGAVRLDFDPAHARPGLHALTLLLEHPVDGPPDGAGNPPMASQRAWLLLALGGPSPGPAVRLAADALRLDVRATSRCASRAPTARATACACARSPRAACGRKATAPRSPSPRRARPRAALPLVRAGAPRGSRHAVLLVAEALDGPVARTAVLAVPVEVAADPSLLPRCARAAAPPRARAPRAGPGLRGATRASVTPLT